MTIFYIFIHYENLTSLDAFSLAFTDIYFTSNSQEVTGILLSLFASNSRVKSNLISCSEHYISTEDHPVACYRSIDRLNPVGRMLPNDRITFTSQFFFNQNQVTLENFGAHLTDSRLAILLHITDHILYFATSSSFTTR